jgi:hypothetical protein
VPIGDIQGRKKLVLFGGNSHSQENNNQAASVDRRCDAIRMWVPMEIVARHLKQIRRASAASDVEN